MRFSGPLSPVARIAILAATVLFGGFAVCGFASPPSRTEASAMDFGSAASTGLVGEGRSLFEESCASCHGLDAEGVKGQGPSLIEAGAAAADFYLSTGRMPLGQVGDQPLRTKPSFNPREIAALVAYVGSLGNGPAIPVVRPTKGSISNGMELFSESCAGCHAISGAGGVAIGAFAPALNEATPTQVGEAIRVGPYLMPRFSERQLDAGEVDSIARYVQLTQNPDDAGGFGLGHIGPVPEGAVAWLAAIAALLLIARLIGERSDGTEGPRR